MKYFERSPPVKREDIEQIWDELGETWREMDYLYQYLRKNEEKMNMASAAIQADVQAILDSLAALGDEFAAAFKTVQDNEDADVIATFQPVADKIKALSDAAKNQPAPPFQTNPDTAAQAESPPAEVTPSPDAASSVTSEPPTDVASTPPDNTTVETPTT